MILVSDWKRVPLPPAVQVLDKERRCKEMVDAGIPLAEAIRRLEGENWAS